MTPITRLADHVRRTLHGPMWHGPAMLEVLDGVSAAIAAARPVSGAHTIWELVLHSAVWAEIARERVHGRSPQSPPPAEDFPAVTDASEAAWAGAVSTLRSSYEALSATVASLSEADLARVVPGAETPHTVRDLLYGVIEHGTYHGGQIALLKRAAAGA
jgi:uncharacterized damage-inducible protein DinB